MHGVCDPLLEDDEERLKVIRYRPIGRLGTIPNQVLGTRAFKLWWNYDEDAADLILKPSYYQIRIL